MKFSVKDFFSKCDWSYLLKKSLDSWTLKLHNMILDCVTNSFNVIPRLFICSRELRIIEYVQSQETTKTSNMESFATIVNKALLKSILQYWWGG